VIQVGDPKGGGPRRRGRRKGKSSQRGLTLGSDEECPGLVHHRGGGDCWTKELPTLTFAGLGK